MVLMNIFSLPTYDNCSFMVKRIKYIQEIQTNNDQMHYGSVPWYCQIALLWSSFPRKLI